MRFDTNYQSYLLRVWRDGADQPWRASLQSTATEKIESFGDLHALIAFLLNQLSPDQTNDDSPQQYQ
ncbi:MAG: hypothetical protein R2867_38440 [Caldilineaceae bacterium]